MKRLLIFVLLMFVSYPLWARIEIELRGISPKKALINAIKGSKTAVTESLIKDAKKGDVDAQVELAICYYDGDGVAVNHQEAYKWALKAAKQGDSRGQFVVAHCLYYGYGVKKDIPKAINYFNLSAKPCSTDKLK